MAWFLPREQDFFELFERAAANVHQGAVEMLELLEDFGDVSGRAKRIKDIEHAGDRITHETLDRLNRTFITPLDREDIHRLVVRLDDVIDLIDTSVNRMRIYRIERPKAHVVALARCLRHQTALLVKAMPLLRNMKNARHIQEICVAIHTQENDADRIMHEALGELFENHHDPVEIIKWKDLYGEVEAATDRCEDVANVLDAIVLKNA